METDAVPAWELERTNDPGQSFVQNSMAQHLNLLIERLFVLKAMLWTWSFQHLCSIFHT